MQSVRFSVKSRNDLLQTDVTYSFERDKLHAEGGLVMIYE
jgi:hypothetical protein